MIRVSRIVVILVAGLLLTLTACGRNASDHRYKPRGPIEIKQTYQGEYPIHVVCTTGMVADLVRQVGGKHVRVTQLMQSDVDPHQYKASSSDMIALGQADVIFYSGMHLEGKMTEILEGQSGKRPTFPVAEYLTAEEVLLDEHGTVDPHIWFDVALWNRARGVVEDVLIKFDPKHADDYRTQGAAYREELDKLHAEVKEKLQSVPKQQRVLITAHDAFRYFGKAYDIEVKGIQGISTESEASVADINELVTHIVNNKIKAVFVESTINEKNVQALIEGCKARGHALVIGGELYSDAMGPAGSGADSYPGMIRHNVTTIVNALK